ncbi:septum site-determining protein MinC [Salicola sp. Rm-C-2C1-2]|uniref:septum site-determining protein MinC n=1 Tax=Salicola sp. Rm-C-2C1-2 TaxID=3141321 RepID=UPI0032E36AEC
MSEPAATATENRACFELRDASQTLTVMELYHFDPDTLEQTLRDKIRQAPNFFRDLPLVIGLDHYEGNVADLDFFQLIGICRTHSIQVLGVRGGNDDVRRLARNAALAWLPGSRTSAPRPAPEPEPAESTPQEPAAAAAQSSAIGPGRLVTQPVRSGQQVYAPEGDLIIMAPVGAGAEVLAAGHIHIYGPLRGRALAGVHGDTSASIFCQSLEAELVSVAGHYKISEDLQGDDWRTPARIRLEGQVLTADPLTR